MCQTCENNFKNISKSTMMWYCTEENRYITSNTRVHELIKDNEHLFENPNDAIDYAYNEVYVKGVIVGSVKDYEDLYFYDSLKNAFELFEESQKEDSTIKDPRFKVNFHMIGSEEEQNKVLNTENQKLTIYQKFKNFLNVLFKSSAN